MRQASLQGLKIFIPRPRPMGEHLANLIEACGGTAHLFPVIEITPPDNFAALDTSLRQLSEVDLMVLVSVSAVNGLVERQRTLYKSALTQGTGQAAIPTSLKVAAVGAKTAARCESLGIKVDFVPAQRVDSEGLLECMDGFNVKDKQVIIFRGQSGRELLKIELKKLGAQVKYVECYRRRTTSQSIQPIIEKWLRGDINAVLITSVSILESLIQLLGKPNTALLKETNVITISERIAEQCTKLGINNVVVSASPAEHSILEKLQAIGTPLQSIAKQ